ncbi:hypothetical protein GC093_11145 [Paenibacillus sp. LMG 31456]|uniref:Transposon Tn7 transposition protein TnsD C-termianl domain-containing protein n=1 Tax=Paenibacillus foliorum TaxID=2654974 RepID=A0A972JYQ1_9BACL|nr:TnsD family Tn7-like transposition protein [Paenibacillus foliorum]NOU93774.1 hypothetical protein [Paenibacillus foliorum]
MNFFVTTYNDEDIRSIVIRMHMLSAKTQFSDTIRSLFNRSSGKTTVFPENLDYFVNNIFENNNSKYTLEYFINRHTYVPIIRTFKDKEVYIKILSYFQGKRSSTIFFSLLFSFLKDEISFCPQCLIEDYHNGDIYIHRMHQFKNINKCAIHGIDLKSRCPGCNRMLATETSQIYKLECQCGFDFENSSQVKMCTLSEYEKILLDKVDYLLNNEKLLFSEDISDRYRAFAFERGFINSSGKFLNKLILQEVNYILSKLNMDLLDISNKTQYLTHISGDLIVHLCIMEVLFGEAAGFFENNLPEIAMEIPYGSGPWNCQNKYCDFFEEPIIKKCKRSKTKSKDINTILECPICKFTYSILNIPKSPIKILFYGPKWKKEQSKLKNSKAKNKYYRKTLTKVEQNVGVKKTYTFEWFLKLIVIFERTKSINQTAKELGVRHETIKRYVNLYQKHGDAEIFKSLPVYSGYVKEKLNTIKIQILLIMDNNESINRYSISEIIGYNSYYYLLKNDSSWAEHNLPQKRAIKKKKDWQEEDNVLSLKVLNIIDQLKLNPPKGRVGRNTIFKRLGVNDRVNLGKYWDGMPNCTKLIDEFVSWYKEYKRLINV